MKRALLLACLCLGPAAATSPRMSDLPRTAPISPALLGQARPTLDLLVTVRLLANLLERGTLAPDAAARAELADVLRGLRGRPALGPLAAARTLEALHAALTPGQRQTLETAHADLERRANLLLSRARFATPDGPANVTLGRYGFMQPGGLTLARRVAANPELNPYAESGASAALLERLLARLAP